MPVTTGSYVVVNLPVMTIHRPPGWITKTPQQRRRTYIAEWRKYRGLTQQQLADELNTTKATISRIEGRIIGYSQDFLEACADVLGVHTSTLLSHGPPSKEDEPPEPLRRRGAG